MNLGIRADQFIALFVYAESRAPPNRRLDKQFERDRVEAWLIRSPRNGKQISNFQSEVQHTTDGKALYLFLEQHFEPQPSITVPSTTVVAAATATASNTIVPPPIPSPSLLATVAELPAVYLQYNTTDVPGHIRIQAYGPGTFPLKDKLKRAPYAMNWAGDKTHPKKSDYWYKTVSNLMSKYP